MKMTNIPPPPAPHTVGKPAQGFAVAALIAGIASFLIGWMPFLGVLVGAAAVVFGILALRRRQSKGFAVTGIVLGGVAGLTSIVTTLLVIVAAVAGPIPDGAASPVQTNSTPSAQPTPAIEVTTPEPEDPAPLSFGLAGDGNTARAEMGGDYSFEWETAGDCYYGADLEGGNESLFTADSATSGTGYVYDLEPGEYYVQMITGPAPGCGWTVTFTQL